MEPFMNDLGGKQGTPKCRSCGDTERPKTCDGIFYWCQNLQECYSTKRRQPTEQEPSELEVERALSIRLVKAMNYGHYVPEEESEDWLREQRGKVRARLIAERQEAHEESKR